MIHGSPPPGTVRIGLAAPTYGPVTGVIVVNFKVVPGSAPAGADAPSTGTTLTRATPSAAISHLILLIFCLLLREPRQRSAGPDGPRTSPFPRPSTGPGSGLPGATPARRDREHRANFPSQGAAGLDPAIPTEVKRFWPFGAHRWADHVRRRALCSRYAASTGAASAGWFASDLG